MVDIAQQEINQKENLTFVFKNWAQTVSARPDYFYEPLSKEDIQKIILNCLQEQRTSGIKQIVKVIGKGHSPNNICVHQPLVDQEAIQQSDQIDHKLHMIRLNTHMNKVLKIDRDSKLVTIQGGTTLKQILDALHQDGTLSISNLPSISDLTFAGLIATGTHGTGMKNKIIASMVKEIEIIDGQGKIIRCSSETEPDLFKAMQCSLGALGIITELTIQCEDEYRLECHEVLMPYKEVMRNYDKMLNENDFLRFWYIPHTQNCVVWRANKTQKPILPAQQTCHTYYSINLYQQLLNKAIDQPGLLKWVNRFFMTMLFRTPKNYIEIPEKALTFNCLFPQHTMEIAIPLENTQKCLEQLIAFIAKEQLFVNFPLEVRFTGKDDIYLSSCEGMDTCWIGIVMYRPFLKDPPQYKAIFDGFERIATGLGGRPHWAKAFDKETFRLRESFPRTADKFLQIRDQLDPENIFKNEFLVKVLK